VTASRPTSAGLELKVTGISSSHPVLVRVMSSRLAVATARRSDGGPPLTALVVLPLNLARIFAVGIALADLTVAAVQEELALVAAGDLASGLLGFGLGSVD
jgi:hypothetical protein